ncbi:MAG TPA: hypothetical protein VFN35_12150 [Ktedonobacteraceae bacterium]|nr:hypothetical protein [Ktedonobacteraceae bacterium]
MVSHVSFLVTLVALIDRLPMPPQASKRGRGHPRVYPDHLFLKALMKGNTSSISIIDWNKTIVESSKDTILCMDAGTFAAAERFCCAFDELRNDFRPCRITDKSISLRTTTEVPRSVWNLAGSTAASSLIAKTSSSQPFHEMLISFCVLSPDRTLAARAHRTL